MNLLTLADGPDGMILPGAPDFPVGEGTGNGLTLGVRPEHVGISEADGIPAELAASDYLGADTIVTARIGNQNVNARLSGHFQVTAGETVRLTWAEENVHFFDAETGRRVDGTPQPARDG